jgi:hypothetical protein
MNFFTTATPNLLRYEQAAGYGTTSRCLSWGLIVWPKEGHRTRKRRFADTSVRSLRRRSLYPSLRFHFQSSTRPSSSSLSKISLTLPATVRRFDWHRCSSSPWRLKMLPQRLDGLRLALLRMESLTWPGRNSSASTNSSEKASAPTTTRARWSQTLAQGTSESKSTIAHSFRIWTPDLVGRVSKRGSLNPQSRSMRIPTPQ